MTGVAGSNAVRLILLGRSNGGSRVFDVAQRDVTYDLPRLRVGEAHGVCSMRFNELAVDVMLRYISHSQPRLDFH